MLIQEWKRFINRFHIGEVSDAEVAQWQQNSLTRVLEHVYDQSPFYRKRLAGIDLSAVTPSNLGVLPYTTKNDLSDAMYDIVCGDIRDALYFFCTTGTTGRSSPCPRSVLDFDLDNSAITLSLGTILQDWLPDEKPVLAMLCPNETHSVCLTISAAARDLRIFKFDAFPASPAIGFKRVFELLQQLKANVVVCSPGLLMALAEMAEAYGIDPKEDLSVIAALNCGELCTPSMAHLVGETWGARSCNWWYGSQEAGTPLVATPAGDFVLLTPNHIFEVLDIETGEPIRGGGRGEMCLTTLIPGMKPLIRYRTGDLIELKKTTEGRPTVEMLGRVKDMVPLGGRRRSAAEIETAILGMHGLIYGYQLEVTKKDGRDNVLVRVKARPSSDHAETKRVVAEGVQDAFDVDCRVEILPLLDLTTATGGWVSWKSARIKDLRETIPDDIEVRSSAELAKAAMGRI
jgi:phenylacetate-CoA ligase